MRAWKRSAAGAVWAWVSVMAGSARGDEVAERLRSAAEKHNASLVMVKGVLTIEMMGQSQQQKVEIPGVVVDGSGLIVATAIKGRQGAKLSMESAKVVLPDGREFDLKEEGNDDEYSLSYFRIDAGKDEAGAKEKKEPAAAPPKDLKALDLGAKGKLALGDEIVVLRRHSAVHPEPIGVEDRIVTVLAKPKTLCLLSGGHPGACLVVDGKGNVAGITAIFQETTPDGNRQMLIVLPLDQVANAVKNFGSAPAGGDKK